MSLEESNNYFQTDHLYIYSSTIPENMAKIGPVDFEITGLGRNC